MEGLRGEYSIAELCRREGIAQSQYYSWSKEFLEAGKKRLSGDTERQANSGEVKDLRREAFLRLAHRTGPGLDTQLAGKAREKRLTDLVQRGRALAEQLT